MSTTYGATGWGRTAVSARRFSRFMKGYWDGFQERRKREMLRADLYDLTDWELKDIGIARGEIDYAASNRGIDLRGIRATCGTFLIAMVCTACAVLFSSEARAQCTARDVLQNQLRLKKSPSVSKPQILVRSAVEVPVWKTIRVGTFADPFSLINALDAVGCGIGNLAGEILARPAFTLSATKTKVELFAVSAAELGFETNTASLADIYARANQLGFGLAAAELGAQLRLQYFDQPIGEFLIIGMEPIKTWKGDHVILTVAKWRSGINPHRPRWQRRRTNIRGLPFSVRAVQ
jgi:uncharacterized protein YjiS (DUF1127 family)